MDKGPSAAFYRRGPGRPPPKPPPRTQCEPQDVAGLGPRRPRRAIRNCAGEAGARTEVGPTRSRQGWSVRDEHEAGRVAAVKIVVSARNQSHAFDCEPGEKI